MSLVQKVVTTIVVALVLIQGNTSYAQENLKWFTQYEAKINKLIKQKDCDGIFNYLWPKAKAGDLAARFWLLTFVSPMIHGDGLTMPGHDRTVVTTTRDGTILAAHTLGLDFGRMSDSENMWYEIFLGPQTIFGTRHFQECLKNEKSKNCTKLAIEQNLVPTFEQYANEIDGLITYGATPVCSFYPESAVDISPESKN